jgi:chromosome segregation ATPase
VACNPSGPDGESTGLNSGFATITDGNPKELAEEAKFDFVRKCTVAMSVKSADMLPLKALQQFCGTTTAVYECRQKIEFSLKEVHESNGDVQAYCDSAYDWFQGKYGMNCPSQCHKLQCKATCQWLLEKEQIDKRSKELDGMKLDVSSLEAKLTEAKKKEDKLNALVTAKNQTVARAEKFEDQAEADVTEAKDKAATCESKVADVKNKSTYLKATETSMEKNLTKFKADLDALKQSFDMGEVKHTGILNQVQHLKENIEEAKGAIAGYEDKVSSNSNAIEDLQKGIAENEKKVEDLTGRIEEKNATYLKWVDAVKTAKDHLEEAKANDEPMTTVRDFEDLVRQQRERRDTAMDELAKLVRDRNKVKQTIAHSGRQVESRMGAISELEGNMSDTTTKMQTLTTELQQKEQEAAQVEGAFTAQRERASQWQTKIESDEETLETVAKTITDTKERLSYHSEKLKAASKALK